MFLLTEGEVALTVKAKLIDTIYPRGVFGEMAVISELPGEVGVPRTATATATIATMAISLEVRETEKALVRTPEFALMLMSVIFERLRFLAARLATRPDTADHHSNKNEPIFDATTLENIHNRFVKSTVVRFSEGAKISRRCRCENRRGGLRKTPFRAPFRLEMPGSPRQCSTLCHGIIGVRHEWHLLKYCTALNCCFI